MRPRFKVAWTMRVDPVRKHTPKGPKLSSFWGYLPYSVVGVEPPNPSLDPGLSSERKVDASAADFEFARQPQCSSLTHATNSTIIKQLHPGYLLGITMTGSC